LLKKLLFDYERCVKYDDSDEVSLSDIKSNNQLIRNYVF